MTLSEFSGMLQHSAQLQFWQYTPAGGSSKQQEAVKACGTVEVQEAAVLSDRPGSMHVCGQARRVGVVGVVVACRQVVVLAAEAPASWLEMIDLRVCHRAGCCQEGCHAGVPVQLQPSHEWALQLPALMQRDRRASRAGTWRPTVRLLCTALLHTSTGA